MITSLSTLLSKEFARRKKANPRYSLRAFAKFLELDVGTLSRVLRDQQELGTKKTVALLGKLKLDPTLRASLIRSLTGEEKTGVPEDSDYELIDDISEKRDSWEFSAIVELLATSRTFNNAAQVAKALGIGTARARYCLEILESLGTVERKTGRWKSAVKKQSLSRKSSKAIRTKIHQGYLEQAMKALHELNEDEASITGITVAGNSEHFLEAVERIKTFRRSLATFLEDASTKNASKDRLYRVNIQLFTLDRKPVRTPGR